MFSQRKVRGWERRKKPYAEYWGLSENLGHMSNSSSWSRLQVAASIIWYLVVRTPHQGQSHTSLLWIKCIWLSSFKGGKRCSTTHLSSDLSLAMTSSTSPKSPFLYRDRVQLPCSTGCAGRTGRVPKCSWGAWHNPRGRSPVAWAAMYFAIWTRNWDNSGVDARGRNKWMDLCKVSTPWEGEHYNHVLCRRQGCRKGVNYFKHCFRRMKSQLPNVSHVSLRSRGEHSVGEHWSERKAQWFYAIENHLSPLNDSTRTSPSHLHKLLYF